MESRRRGGGEGGGGGGGAEHAPGRNLILDEDSSMWTLYKYQEWLQCIIFPVSHNWAIVVVENKSAQETRTCI
jgi:hypothetical protein